MNSTEITYSEEEIQMYLRGNYVVMTLLPMKFLNKQKQSVKEYAEFIGETLTVTWKDNIEDPLATKAKSIALNYVAAGARNVSFAETEQGLTIIIGNWPNPSFLRGLGMEKSIVDDFNYVWNPIAKFLGMTFSFEPTETGYILKFTK